MKPKHFKNIDELKDYLKDKQIEEVNQYIDVYHNEQDKLKGHKLGIVYTPKEVSDFIVESVKDILKTEFDKDLSDDDVEILDPFTGSGIFINSLVEHMEPQDVDKKLKDDTIQAMEIDRESKEIGDILLNNKLKKLGCKENIKIKLGDTFELYDLTNGFKE